LSLVRALSSDERYVLSSSGVLSQGSAFLLDGDNTASFEFPANYVVLNFDAAPLIEESAALFETVGRIDPELFETNTSGYNQYGRPTCRCSRPYRTRNSSLGTCKQLRSSASNTR
jgi:hypothetical protein